MLNTATVAYRKVFRSSNVGKSSTITAEEAQYTLNALAATRQRMGDQWRPNQVLGRREPIGCVALEITQRCNLDCTLCYLSQNSESVRDLPIQEIFHRIDNIKKSFGPGTSVQITGGDPTLRNRQELVEIVKYTRSIGMVPALFTNGIKCSRELLQDLCAVGLNDVAFHIDLTQERKGFKTEKDLNAVRQEYMDRAKGLPLTVIFNTTVHDGNFHEIPDLVRFFMAHTDQINFVSFQLQADTGRGELRKRGYVISTETVREQINKGVGRGLDWDRILYGHPKCHSYVPTLSINGNLHEVVKDQKFLNCMLEDFSYVMFDRRQSRLKLVMSFLWEARRRPIWYLRGIKWLADIVWRAKWDLIKSGGTVNRLSFFVHNFMDAKELECDRVNACSFMVITPEGPISMCAHNAKRDEYILKPTTVQTEQGAVLWNPLGEKPRIAGSAGRRDDPTAVTIPAELAGGPLAQALAKVAGGSCGSNGSTGSAK